MKKKRGDKKKLYSNKTRSDIKEMKINLLKYICVESNSKPINIHFVSCQKIPQRKK